MEGSLTGSAVSLKHYYKTLPGLSELPLHYCCARRLCAVMLDCKGRDILVKRAHEQTDTGWPTYVEKLKITAGQKVGGSLSLVSEWKGCK